MNARFEEILQKINALTPEDFLETRSIIEANRNISSPQLPRKVAEIIALLSVVVSKLREEIKASNKKEERLGGSDTLPWFVDNMTQNANFLTTDIIAKGSVLAEILSEGDESLIESSVPLRSINSAAIAMRQKQANLQKEIDQIESAARSAIEEIKSSSDYDKKANRANLLMKEPDVNEYLNLFKEKELAYKRIEDQAADLKLQKNKSAKDKDQEINSLRSKEGIDEKEKRFSELYKNPNVHEYLILSEEVQFIGKKIKKIEVEKNAKKDAVFAPDRNALDQAQEEIEEQINDSQKAKNKLTVIQDASETYLKSLHDYLHAELDKHPELGTIARNEKDGIKTLAINSIYQYNRDHNAADSDDDLYAESMPLLMNDKQREKPEADQKFKKQFDAIAKLPESVRYSLYSYQIISECLDMTKDPKKSAGQRLADVDRHLNTPDNKRILSKKQDGASTIFRKALASIGLIFSGEFNKAKALWKPKATEFISKVSPVFKSAPSANTKHSKDSHVPPQPLSMKKK